MSDANKNLIDELRVIRTYISGTNKILIAIMEDIGEIRKQGEKT